MPPATFQGRSHRDSPHPHAVEECAAAAVVLVVLDVMAESGKPDVGEGHAGRQVRLDGRREAELRRGRLHGRQVVDDDRGVVELEREPTGAGQRLGEDVDETVHRLQYLDEQVTAGREGAPQARAAAAPVGGDDIERRLERYELLDAQPFGQKFHRLVAVGGDVPELVETGMQQGGGETGQRHSNRRVFRRGRVMCGTHSSTSSWASRKSGRRSNSAATAWTVSALASGAPMQKCTPFPNDRCRSELCLPGSNRPGSSKTVSSKLAET